MIGVMEIENFDTFFPYVQLHGPDHRDSRMNYNQKNWPRYWRPDDIADGFVDRLGRCLGVRGGQGSVRPIPALRKSTHYIKNTTQQSRI